MVSPNTIDKAVEGLLGDASADIATTSEAITEVTDELLNPNVVKVVTSAAGHAIYFSRSPMPFPREATLKYGSSEKAFEQEPALITLFRKHTGLYVYRREYLLRFTQMPPSLLEQIEMLEQLRAIENGDRIRVVEVAETSIGVDTADDLERVRILLERDSDRSTATGRSG